MNETPLGDTSDAAARVQLELIRRAAPERRIEACLGLSRSMIALSRSVLRDRRPDLGELEREIEWIKLQYGAELAAAVRARLAARR